MKEETQYKRILLKLSGEVLAGEQKNGVNAEVLGKLCDEIKKVVELGVQVATVIKWKERQLIIWECLQLQ